MPNTAATLKEPSGLMTMADLATRFSLPESTARYYCKRFNAFLPQEGQGRRRYKAEAVPVFAAIQEAMRRTRHARSVEMELSLQFTAVPAENQDGGVVSGAVPGVPAALVYDYNPAAVLQEFSRGILQILGAQAQALERIADALSASGLAVAPQGGAGRVAAPGAPDAPGATASQTAPGGGANAGEASADIESLRKEIKTLRGLMDSSEQIHQQDVEQLRKWLNRLGSGQSGAGE